MPADFFDPLHDVAATITVATITPQTNRKKDVKLSNFIAAKVQKKFWFKNFLWC
jgi:ABC-type ATPase with predicted acetyltransferase domain